MEGTQMLVLRRTPGQSIDFYYPGGHFRLTLVEVEGLTARLSIDAPREVNILRSEVPYRAP